MSSSLNLRIADFGAVRPRRQAVDRRRALLLALAAGPLLSLPAAANTSAEAFAGLRRWGRGEFRRFGFLVYEATLWAGDDPQRPPLALRLDYRRHVEGKAIAEASVREIRRFVRDEDALQRWGGQMQRIFPDVKPGDHIVGVYRSDGARFFQDERLIGAIDAPGFADAFFAIWLDPRTSAPELRSALLRRSEA
jgi:hypothetical protein